MFVSKKLLFKVISDTYNVKGIAGIDNARQHGAAMFNVKNIDYPTMHSARIWGRLKEVSQLKETSVIKQNRKIDQEEKGISGLRLMREATVQNVWGMASAVDIYNCNPSKIRDADEIRRFVVELCDLIQMKRFGDTQVIHFGEDERVAGYSMVQLIETSLISAHFANQTNNIYLDVFSCKPYNPETVRVFAENFFGGSNSILHVTMRR